MQQRTVKEEAARIIKQLPDHVSWEDIMYNLYVRQKREKGIKAADEGKVISQEEMERKYFKDES